MKDQVCALLTASTLLEELTMPSKEIHGSYKNALRSLACLHRQEYSRQPDESHVAKPGRHLQLSPGLIRELEFSNTQI